MNYRFVIQSKRGDYDSEGESTPPRSEIVIAIGKKEWRWDIPEIVKPVRKLVVYSAGGETKTYPDFTQRCYGIYLFENHFNVAYGNASNSSKEEQRWSCFLPWNEQRFVRHSHYDTNGLKIILTHWQEKKSLGSKIAVAGAKVTFHNHERWAAERAEVANLCNSFTMAFADFDGQEILATLRTEEREWRRGTGWFKWLSWFYPAKIRKSLDIEFIDEVGPGKGSWKGGTLGHGTEMIGDEHPIVTWARYCDENKLTPLLKEEWEIEQMRQESEARKAARRAANKNAEQEAQANVAAVKRA